MTQADDAGQRRLTVWVRGRVQGVGFRWWVRCRALELGLTGTATNRPDGRVEVVAEGPGRSCEELLALLSEDPPRPPPPGAGGSWYRRPGRVTGVATRWSSPHGGVGFREG
jgi:acylphosphatase